MTAFAWRNPQAQIYFDVNVKENDGTVTQWAAQNSSPGVLTQRGWNRNSLKPGGRVMITVFPSKAGTPVGVSPHLELEDDTKFLRKNPDS